LVQLLRSKELTEIDCRAVPSPTIEVNPFNPQVGTCSLPPAIQSARPKSLSRGCSAVTLEVSEEVHFIYHREGFEQS